MTGVIYARYSEGPHQTDQSIEGQVADCKAYAARNGIKILGVYADRHISGKSAATRPEFQRLIEDAQAGRFDCVVVWKIDRFGRNREDIALYKLKLKRAGVKLFYAAESVPEGPEGIILESVLEGIAEYYSEDLRQKVIRGRRETLKKGILAGEVLPIGYTRDENRHVVIDEEKASLVREVFRKYIFGDGLMSCVDYLNDHHLTGARGAKISKGVVGRMLRNRRYLGIFDECGVELRFDPIIDPQTFEEAQKMHKTSRNRNTNAAGKAKEPYLLSCRCFCGYCQTMIVADCGTGKMGKVYRYYACPKHKRGGDPCELKPIPRDVLEDLVVSATIKDMLTDETIKALTDEVMDIQAEGAKESPAVPLRAALDGNKKKQANIVRAIELGNAPDVLVSRLQELSDEAAELEQKIRQAEYDRPTIPREVIEGWLRSFKNGDKKDPEFRRRLVETFVARVDVYNDKAIIYYNITEKGQKNKAASGVRIRPVTWSSRNGIRTPGKPFVYGKYYILIVPFSHAA